KENERKSESDGEKEVKTDENKNVVQSQAVSDSSVSSYISYPPMHRYHNCVINEEEEDDDDDEVLEQEETSESLFSVSINQRRISMSFLVEVDDDKEVNSPLKVSTSPEVITKTIGLCSNESDVNQRVDSLLNPIENLAQWRTLKARPLPTLDHRQEKENVDLEQDMPIPLSEEPRSKVAERKGNPKTNTAVTTSLSSWLVEPEKTTASKEESQYSTGNSYTYSDGATSWKSIEDRPILGAWTIDEVKHISARSSPRKSPSRSNPDETPIIGTVGSYWTHTGQATDSSNSCTSPMGMSVKSRRNRELKASSCHSSPSKRRLEKAFEKTVA
ncbi:JASON-like protein, partial [Tanacetum coccineum]